jgi:serine/threonine protein kinase
MRTNARTRTNTRTKQGGKVLASGGFGCVFTPALKCDGARHREKGKVSKLMTEKHAISEYKEINSFKTKLDTIKNYEDYYLLYDATLCKPAELTDGDLTAFAKKCTALAKKDITKQNINDNLDKLLMLNMPNGGVPVDDFLYTNGTIEKMSRVHTSLVNLLKNGIVPMNKKHIYHCDIKDSNILVQETDSSLKTRLIDWGLSTEYVPFKDQPFPSTWRNRPLQFNVPFSVIIFSDDFIEKYTTFIKNEGTPDKIQLKQFVSDFVVSWMEKRGGGHYKFINEIMYMLFSDSMKDVSLRDMPDVIETQITMPYIVNYIVDVLTHFTVFRNDGTLNLRDYLDNVFVEIVDIYGFISAYYPMLEILYSNRLSLSGAEHEIFKQLNFIFVEYLYAPRHEPIKMPALLADLKILGDTISISAAGRKHTSPTASGIKTRKRMLLRKNASMSFKQRPKYRRFKNPVFLSSK